MKSVSISGSFRKSVGRTDAKLLRKEAKIPCVLYGGNEQYKFAVDEIALEKIISTPEVYIVKIDLEGKVIDSIVQEIQCHPVTDKILHADFYELVSGKKVTVNIPIILTGASEGVLKGGVLLKKLKKIKLKALPEHLPENITISIEKLDIGDSIRISDLDLGAEIQILEMPNNVIVGVRTARTVIETTLEGSATAEGAATAEGSATAEGAAAKGAAPAAKGSAPAAKGAAPAKGKEKSK